MRRALSGGFTLLELLVVLALAGLLMSVVPSLLAAALPGTELRVQSRELAASLRHSHNRAIAMGTNLDVTINFEPPQYIVDQNKPHSLPEGITISATKGLALRSDHSPGHSGRIPEDRFRIRFYPDGSSSGAIITLRWESLAYTLKVGWLLGRVSMTSGIPDDAS